MGNMRLPERIIVDSEKTFGNLKFQALHRVGDERDGSGNSTGEVSYISYDLRSSAQGMVVTVILPGGQPEKDIPYLTPVRLVNATARARADQNYGAREPRWSIYADDIVPIDTKAEGDTVKAGAAPQPGADAAKAGAAPQAKKG